MFIVMKLHRESLREMMNQGRVSHSIKVQVLKMLKPKVCRYTDGHGDIKDFMIFHHLEINCDLKSQTNSQTIFWSTMTSTEVSSQTSNVVWAIGAQRVQTILVGHRCMPARGHTKEIIEICFPSDDWCWSFS